MEGRSPTPAEEAQRLYAEAEARTAKAMETVVGSDAFGEILARVSGNVLALMKVGNDLGDLAVRNLRLAGRKDITGLARQLARTEDKLELVLQEVERLQDRLDASDATRPAQRSRAANGRAPARAASGARRGSRARKDDAQT